MYNIIKGSILTNPPDYKKGVILLKADQWGPEAVGLMGLQVHELIDNSMYEVLGSTHTQHFYYACKGYPEFRDKSGKRWWGIYECSNGIIWCKNDLNGHKGFNYKDLEVVKKC